MIKKKHVQICPHCGQAMLLPKELRNLGLRGKEIEAMIMLHKRSPGVIIYSSISKSKGTVWQIANKIREALNDTGSDWALVNVKDLGYKLIKRKELSHNQQLSPNPITRSDSQRQQGSSSPTADA